jgi:hypothetical protein
MSTRQGQPRGPQIPRGKSKGGIPSQIAMLVLALAVQAGKGVRKVKDETGIKEVAIPKEPGAAWLLKEWNRVTHKLCKAKNKKLFTYNLTQLQGKLNTLSNWYRSVRCKVADGFLSEVARHSFGNIPRSAVSTVVEDEEGNETFILRPEYEEGGEHYGKVQEARFYGDEGFELEGIETVSGRTVGDVIDEEYVDDSGDWDDSGE